MGDAARPSAPDAAQLEAFQRKLEEFEAMGLDTTPLRRVLEVSPQNFEREAEAFLRRELTGEEPAAPEPAEPEPVAEELVGPQPPAEEPVAPAPPPHAPAPPAPAPPAVAAPSAPEPVAPPPVPPSLEAAWAKFMAPEAQAPAPEPVPEAAPLTDPLLEELPFPPEPAATEEPQPIEPPAEWSGTQAAQAEPARDAIEEAMQEELEDAMAEEDLTQFVAPYTPVAPRPPRPPSHGGATPPPPPLASGDSLGVGATPAPRPPAPAGSAPSPARKPPPPSVTAKPPPPGAARAPGAPVRPMKVVAAAQPKVAPPGAKPAAVGVGATEVLPTEHKSRGKLGLAAGFAVLLVTAGLFYFLFANGAPVAVLNVANGPFEAGQLITFSANGSKDPNGDPLRYAWEFGDGGTATGAVTSHAYAHSGNFTVVLVATDRDGLAGRAQSTVTVTPGTITAPPYRYGDRLDATVSGSSNVEATGANPAPLGTFKAALPPLETLERTYNIWGVNLSYSGTQYREIGPRASTVKDGFLVDQDTYESKRSLDLDLAGIVENDSPMAEITYTGDSQVTQSDFATLLANDTVRRLSTQHTTVQIDETDPPTVLESSAQLIEYPDLATAADQLRMEAIYVGRSFSTEQRQLGAIFADGYNWTWETQGTALIAGQLTIAINFTLADELPGTSFISLYVKLWISSASAFPLQEDYYIRAVEPGRSYDSFFRSVATGVGTRGTGTIPYGNVGGFYPPPPASAFAPLGVVPAGGASPDFAFNPTDAYTDAQSQPDFTAFLSSNPQAYAVNGSYGLNVGNPRWLIDFDQNGTGETMRIDVERAGTTQARTGAGQASAELTRAQIGTVVSLDYAAGLLEDEEQAVGLFPAGVFTSIYGNFTVRSALSVPSLSFNAASAATRSDIPYAFGVESLPSEANRIRAYIDATTGQIAFSLTESGDSLP